MSVNRFFTAGNRILLALAAICSLVFLAAQAPAQEKVLRLRPYADLKNLDPIWTTAEITANHGYMIYDTLMALDERMEPQPQMLDSHKVSRDGMTYTFTLRSGLRWHDGKPVTAADSVTSIKRWAVRDSLGQKLMARTKSMKVVNNRTFTLTLKEPFGLVLQGLAKIAGNAPFIMPERVAKTDAHEQIKETIGSGPFKFVAEEWMPGNKVVYVKNEDYRPRPEPPSWGAGGKVVKVDRVEWIVIPDFATAAAALAAGEIDYFTRVPVDLIKPFERDPNINVFIMDPIGSQPWLQMNHKHPPFNNVKARQALLWMVNQEDYMRSMVGDKKFWRTCGAYFVCGTPLESDVGTEALMKQDFEKARQLMKEAGYKGEPIIVMDPTDHPTHHPAALVTAQLLRKIGVNVELQAMDWSTLTSRRAMKTPPDKGGWHIFHTRFPATLVLNPAIHTGVTGACDKAWFGWPCDKKLQELGKAWIGEADPAKQKQIAIEVQRRAYEYVPYIITGQFFEPSAHRKELKGVIQAPSLFLWNISKEG